MAAASRPPARNRPIVPVDDVVAWLAGQADPAVRAAMGPRYGIHVADAYGIPMGVLRDQAKVIGRDHALAAALWASGSYEARLLAALVDEPTDVTVEQMEAWCGDFDNWAICDTVCFSLFDRTPLAWTVLGDWMTRSAEFERRAGFALLWGLARHDRTAADEVFADALATLEREAGDERPLVRKAVAMALKAVGARGPALYAAAVATADRLADAEVAPARRVGREVARHLARTPPRG